VRQVGRADEEDIGPIDRGDRVGMLHGARGFDLDDPEDPPVHGPDLAVTDLAQPGAAGRQREPARAIGRVAHEGDRLASLVRVVDARDHDAVRPEVERAADPQPFAGLGSDERGGPRGTDGVELPEQLGFGPGAVFEVDDEPVEAGARHHFGGGR